MQTKENYTIRHNILDEDSNEYERLLQISVNSDM
jgi:hypothetical protein